MKKFDFDKALKELDEEELSEVQTQKAKILVTVLPFVIIILILAVMLLASAQKEDKSGQQTSTEDQTEIATMTPMEEASDEPTAEPTQNPTAEPEVEAEEDEGTMQTPSYVNEPFHAENQLAELLEYFVSDNRKAIEDLVHLDRYKAMSYSLEGTDDFYYYGDKNADGKAHGKGIAVYADNRYYYGTWADGRREGGGFFIHYHMPECYTQKNVVIYHQFTGNWKNDLPDGEGAEHYEYHTDRFEKNTGYNTNLLGNYQNGLIHGTFYITNLYSDGNINEWDAEAQNGSWVYRSDSRDQVGRGPVFVDRKNKDNYIWVHPKENKNIGISCLISSKN